MTEHAEAFRLRRHGLLRHQISTTSGFLPRAPVRNLCLSDAAGTPAVSYQQAFLGIVPAGRFPCLRPVELQRLDQNFLQRSHQLLLRPLLRIHSRDLLDPANPPIVLLFRDRRVSRIHIQDLATIRPRDNSQNHAPSIWNPHESRNQDAPPAGAGVSVNRCFGISVREERKKPAQNPSPRFIVPAPRPLRDLCASAVIFHLLPFDVQRWKFEVRSSPRKPAPGLGLRAACCRFDARSL